MTSKNTCQYITFMYFIFFFTLSCSQRKEPIPQPSITKETFVSKATQAKIAHSTKAMYNSLYGNSRSAGKVKSTTTDTLFQNIDLMQQTLLAELRAEDSTTYDIIESTPQGYALLHNYSNVATPTGYTNLLNSIDIYIANINNEFDALANGSDTLNNAAATEKLKQVTLAYETTILNDINLSNDDKTALLMVTTYLLSSADDLINIAGNISLLDTNTSQRSRFGRWLFNTTRTIKRIAVSTVIFAVKGAVIGVLTGIAIINISPYLIPYAGKILGKSLIAGAIGGALVGISRAIKNECSFILNGQIQVRPCW